MRNNYPLTSHVRAWYTYTCSFSFVLSRENLFYEYNSIDVYRINDHIDHKGINFDVFNSVFNNDPFHRMRT